MLGKRIRDPARRSCQPDTPVFRVDEYRCYAESPPEADAPLEAPIRIVLERVVGLLR